MTAPHTVVTEAMVEARDWIAKQVAQLSELPHRYAEEIAGLKKVSAALEAALVVSVPQADVVGQQARHFWLYYDHQTGRWVVDERKPSVIRAGAEVIHVVEALSLPASGAGAEVVASEPNSVEVEAAAIEYAAHHTMFKDLSWDESGEDFKKAIRIRAKGILVAARNATGRGLRRFRHKRRGSEYVLIGYGKMQADNWIDAASDDPDDVWKTEVDMRSVAIYRSVKDGSLWAQPRGEFEDGRFEELPALAGRAGE